MAKEAVVLLSGGLDSATVLAIATDAGFACRTLSFDYGQRHRHELGAARSLAHAFGAIEHIEFRMDFSVIGGSALTADIEVPKDRVASAMSTGIPVTYVPARNTVFLAVAAGLAESRGCADVFLGVNAVDYSGYPDCRPEFVQAMEEAINRGTKFGDSDECIRIHAPLIRMKKVQIVSRGLELGVDYGMTHSCYDPDEFGGACGRCDSCQIRRTAFEAASVPDPTIYSRHAI